MNTNSSTSLKRISLYGTALSVLAASGVLVRLLEYSRNRSFWLDEIMLALNVLQKSFTSLVLTPLDYDQAAPLGFLVLAKAAVAVAGNSEYAFRAVPLIAGLLSFFVFYKLCASCRLARPATVLAMFFFMTSLELIRYATEFKQYSCEALFFMATLVMGIAMAGKKIDLRNSLFLGAAGAVLLWFSFCTLFALAALGTVLLGACLIEKRWDELKAISVSFACWGASFITLYFFWLKNIAGNPTLEQYWTNSYMPLPLFSVTTLLWAMKRLVGMFYFTRGGLGARTAALFFLAGSVLLLRRNPKQALLLILPLVFAFLVSSVHKYPVEGRQVLFYVPVLYLLMSEGLASLLQSRYKAVRAAGIVFVILIARAPTADFLKEYSHSVVYTEDIKSVLDHIQKNMKERDIIYDCYGADFALRYYGHRYGLTGNIIHGIHSEDDRQKYLLDADKLKGNPRVWIIFSHITTERTKAEEEYILDHVKRTGKVLDRIESEGAAAYLVDLSGS